MRFVNLTWAVTVYVEPARGGGLSYRDNSLGAIMKPLVPMSGALQRVCVQFGEFLTGLDDRPVVHRCRPATDLGALPASV